MQEKVEHLQEKYESLQEKLSLYKKVSNCYARENACGGDLFENRQTKGRRLVYKMELRPDGRRKTNEKLVWMVWKG